MVKAFVQEIVEVEFLYFINKHFIYEGLFRHHYLNLDNPVMWILILSLRI